MDDNNIYCLKCKQKTNSKDITEVITKNNRRMLKGICIVCGSKKSTFVKSITSGKGLLNNVVAKLGDTGTEMHLPALRGEYVPDGSFNNLHKYSYCGPGTKYDQRNSEGYKGINELDSNCKLHDQFYNENTDTATRNISDTALAHRANEIANDSRYDIAQRNMANLVAIIMNTKAKYGWGETHSKNLKRGSTKKK